MSNLLLLEDDISLIDGLHYSLKKNGFYVDIARTVEEAEKQLAQIEKYDLLILDVTLPDGTGFEVCENVRKLLMKKSILFVAWIAAGTIMLQSPLSWGNYVPVFVPCYDVQE